MRRGILDLIVPFIILTITLSFVAVLPVASQTTGAVIAKLETLRSRVEDEHPALGNKVNAVINQIEAGAFNGALNKLQNDVKKSIEAWVENPKELLDLVDEIIKDIEELLHPKPPTPDFEISADPTLEIVQGGSKTVNITINSKNNFSQNVTLTNATSAPGVTLSLDPSVVKPPPNGSVVSKLTVMVALDTTPDEYNIAVTGTTSGFEPKTIEIELTVKALQVVEDTTPPTIASVLRNPNTPAYNESAVVTASVFDEGGSGVKQVILNYSSGSVWTQVEMTLSEGLYNASIPAFPFNTTVEYHVHASDKSGNEAASIIYSYKVIDPYPPTLRIDKPAQGAYLSGTVAVTVFMKDQNSGGESGFGSAELSINGTAVKTWEPPAPSAPDTYNWPTVTFGPDGIYILKLSVRDKAGNVVEKSLTVTVDNTLPTAVINAPADGSYLRLSTLIKVSGSDANFDKMEVRIDDLLVMTFFTSGSEVVGWDTPSHSDGVHSIALKVYDKAGNVKQVLINVTVDNTPPFIGTPSWSPKEPAAEVNIRINVTVEEHTYGSGVENVTLVFKNKTMDDWQCIPMELKNGNWTTVLNGQSDTEVIFFIEAFDRAGNAAENETQKFTVAGPAGFPLAWLLAAIAAIGAGTGGGIYYMRRRRKKGLGSSVPVASSSETAELPPPAPTPVRKPARTKTQSGMLDQPR